MDREPKTTSHDYRQHAYDDRHPGSIRVDWIVDPRGLAELRDAGQAGILTGSSSVTDIDDNTARFSLWVDEASSIPDHLWSKMNAAVRLPGTTPVPEAPVFPRNRTPTSQPDRPPRPPECGLQR